MQWHGEKPHTYINGSAPIDGVYHSPNLEVTAIANYPFMKVSATIVRY
jgi:hypothetical protein